MNQAKKSASHAKRRHWYKRPWLIIPIAVVLLLLAYPAIDWSVWLINGLRRPALTTVGKVSFAHELPIPKLADSAMNTDGTRIFNLTLQTGTTQFFDGVNTGTWGVNGSYLGPTLRAKRGEAVQINVHNNLPEDTSMHWHGMHLPAVMDGGPHQPIAKGATWSPSWTIKQPAATLWYHPHPHEKTEQHLYRGITGMFILDDDNPTAAQLPHEYGTDDIPAIVQDKSFDKNKQLKRTGDTAAATGAIGNEILVNGARTPHLTVTTQQVRLRLLNASTARVYNFGLSNGQDMQMIASDGGLLEKPVLKHRLLLSPGERAEVVIAMQPNEQTTLRAYPFDSGVNSIAGRLNGSRDTLEIMQLRSSATLTPSTAVPAHLATMENIPESSAVTTRNLELTSEETINKKAMDMNRIDFSPVKGTTEMWDVANVHDTPHNFHIHDVQFRVLSVDGTPPPPELQGRKDTIFILPGHRVRLLLKFADYSDPDHPYMFHCHLVRHEDKGMMGQFTVVDPGPRPAGHMDMPGMAR